MEAALLYHSEWLVNYFSCIAAWHCLVSPILLAVSPKRILLPIWVPLVVVLQSRLAICESRSQPPMSLAAMSILAFVANAVFSVLLWCAITFHRWKAMNECKRQARVGSLTRAIRLLAVSVLITLVGWMGLWWYMRIVQMESPLLFVQSPACFAAFALMVMAMLLFLARLAATPLNENRLHPSLHVPGQLSTGFSQAVSWSSLCSFDNTFEDRFIPLGLWSILTGAVLVTGDVAWILWKGSVLPTLWLTLLPIVAWLTWLHVVNRRLKIEPDIHQLAFTRCTASILQLARMSSLLLYGHYIFRLWIDGIGDLKHHPVFLLLCSFLALDAVESTARWAAVTLLWNPVFERSKVK